MPYIKRDKSQKIIALYQTPNADTDDFLPATHPDVANFLSDSSSDGLSKDILAESDLELARITEDLVHLLIQKNHILFTELPAAVQTKLLNREKLRSTISSRNNSNFLDDEGLL